ncbi:MAG TPA: SbcC/MukB-like Walker B domain-containing protein, partial [Roseiflexaceae bacterium]|nr:SbcC/MukB-like Walker B domain-containing protein [Roseiflexaceae bacterium]
EASSDRLAQLQEQLKQVQAQSGAVEADLKRVQAVITTLKNDLDRYERQRAECARRLAATPASLLDSQAARIEADSKSRPIALETVDEVQGQMERFYNQSASSLRGQTNTIERSMTQKMLTFKRDYDEDTGDMDASVEAIGEFRRMHERIAHDDLPTHRKRFKEWLDGKVVDAIVGFQSTLDKKAAEYRESIATLNSSLRTIAYTSGTYIQLTADINRDREIQEFRQTLRSCIPDVGQRTPEANEASFQRIRGLIGRFEKEERWTAKVTDVRNWLDFAAEERYSEDSSIKHYYSDSSGKSGGQKAKLAYTILASAIAYQYGLAQDEVQARTFRFVIVDEAFSKSDETNARFAMDLFKQLNLQLLVVTPLDKTHVVEPYIAACHFVSNSQDETDSQVINMTIAQYHEQKETISRLRPAARIPEILGANR